MNNGIMGNEHCPPACYFEKSLTRNTFARNTGLTIREPRNLPLFGIQQNNWTALYVASNNGHYEVVRVLLAAKATVNTQTKVSFLCKLKAYPHYTLSLDSLSIDPDIAPVHT